MRRALVVLGLLAGCDRVFDLVPPVPPDGSASDGHAVDAPPDAPECAGRALVGAPTLVTGQTLPTGIAMALTPDGAAQLAVVGGQPVEITSFVAVNGQFGPALHSAAGQPGERYADIAFGDFDNDSLADRALLVLSTNSRVEITYGSGADPRMIGADDSARYLVARDLNRDSRTDLAWLANFVLQAVEAISGGFANPSSTPVAEAPTAVAFLQLQSNGDFKPLVVNRMHQTIETVGGGGINATYDVGPVDIASAVDGPRQLVVVATIDALLVYAIANGVIPTPVTLPVAPGVRRVALADLDGNGRQEIIATGSTTGTSGTVVVFRQEPGQAFASWAGGTIPEPPVDIATGDTDGDGDVDIAVLGARGNVYQLRTCP